MYVITVTISILFTSSKGFIPYITEADDVSYLVLLNLWKRTNINMKNSDLITKKQKFNLYVF